ncbi:unnamed protein product [Cryptosporidium hominis]|uniref:Uncharacterized protein n=1 Tax=Cryptosporidium hominis TaxID=237895 RepID=A0A0S4TDF1_CRYHO|nr:hypothetical protein ChTU502y2012_378g0095 [Cryptosporidium hominis]PPA62323.1 Mitotic checkpoint regulator MAD2B-interacting family protein [Cryptosporidium hominis]CUV04807.1 unnamed protein product [Cryptosporidium hominis]
MSSFFHDYLSGSDDDCTAFEDSSVCKEGANEFKSSIVVNSGQLQSEKSDNFVACYEGSLQKKDQITPETCIEPNLIKQISSKIGVKKKEKRKKKNKYLNEFYEISSIENVKTLDLDDLKKSNQEVGFPDNLSREKKLDGDKELRQSCNQKRKHQITWLLNEAKQLRSEFSSTN